MGEDPEVIRREIEETRERMTETVGALGYKADVKTRAKESVSGKVGAVKDKIGGTAGSVSDATPSTGDVKQVAQRAGGVAQDNPLGLAIGSVAVGFLAGLLIPTTQKENEAIGPVADQVKEQVRSTAQEAMEHGKQVAQDVVEHGKEAAQDGAQQAQESAQQHAQEVKETAQENAQQVGSAA